MTPRAYLEQLRGALDEYEVAENEARRCLQERLRELLGTEIDGPIDSAALLPPASLSAEGATGAGFTPPLPSSAIPSSPAGETARSRKGVRASTTAPAAAYTCECGRTFATASGLGGHRGNGHGARRARANKPPQESKPVTASKGGAPAGGSDAGRRAPVVTPAVPSTSSSGSVGTPTPASKHTYVCARCPEGFPSPEARDAHQATHPPVPPAVGSAFEVTIPRGGGSY